MDNDPVRNFTITIEQGYIIGYNHSETFDHIHARIICQAGKANVRNKNW